MKDIDEILKNDDKDSIYYLSQCRKFCELNDWYNALQACEEGIKISANTFEFYQRAIVCCVNMYDVKKAVNFLDILKKICYDEEKILPFSNLIEEKLKEAKEKTQVNTDYEKFIELQKMILSGGGKLPNMTINLDDPNNRYILAADDIKTSDIVAKIPRHLTLIPAEIEKTELGKFFDDNTKKKLNSYEHNIVTVFLLHEIFKDKESKFYPYFNFLPKSYDSFPIFYKQGGPEEKILEDTKFKFLIKNEKDARVSDFKTLQEAVPFMKKISLEEFLFMNGVVTSRLFSFEDNNGVTSCILVPLCDLVNHKKYPNILWNYDKEENTFNFVATKDIKSGEEIFTKYGNKGNENLLLHYGFTLENNVDNSHIFLLKLCNGKKSPEYLSLKVTQDLDDSETKKLFAYLRYMVTDEFIEIAKSNNLPDEVISDEELKKFYVPQSGIDEIKMLKFLGIVIDHYLADYKIPLDDDLKFFEENKNQMSTNEINCWRVRIQEKEILKFYKDFSEFCFTLFTNRSNEVLVSSMVANESYDLYKSYINFVFSSLSNK